MQANTLLIWFLWFIRVFISVCFFIWIGLQLATFMDWVGVAQWLISGAMLLVGFFFGSRSRWQFWALMSGVAIWWIALTIVIYPVLVMTGPPQGDVPPAWVLQVRPLLVSGVPFVVIALAMLVVPMILRRKEH